MEEVEKFMMFQMKSLIPPYNWIMLQVWMPRIVHYIQNSNSNNCVTNLLFRKIKTLVFASNSNPKVNGAKKYYSKLSKVSH